MDLQLFHSQAGDWLLQLETEGYHHEANYQAIIPAGRWMWSCIVITNMHADAGVADGKG